MRTKLQLWRDKRLNFHGSVARTMTMIKNFQKGKHLTKYERERLADANWQFQCILDQWEASDKKTRERALK